MHTAELGTEMRDTKTIVVIGMGYVGIPCAALLADVEGFNVIGLQRRSERSGWKIEWLNAGKCPFEGDEPGLAELIHRVAVEKKTFRVTDDYSVCQEADVILIDVQTPVDEDHIPRYEALREACERVGKYLQSQTLVIIESTVAPGTTQNVVRPILERESGLVAGQPDDSRITPRPGRPMAGLVEGQHARRFYLAFSYERVMPGKLLEFLVNMPRVVGGVDEESTRRAVELYRHIVKREITATDCLTAESAKTVENTYRDVNIAFANEMALVCESLGVDMFEVRRLVNARSDRHVHLPGAGVGGHCLPKDPWLLNHGANCYGCKPVKSELLKVARIINDSMPLHMAQLVEEALAAVGRSVTSSRIAVLGVAYLEDSDDTRNTPAVPLIRELLAKGAEVVAHDPYVRQEEWLQVSVFQVELMQDLTESLRGVDAAVIITRHREYGELARGRISKSTNPQTGRSAGGLAWMRELMRTPVIVDGRNVFDRSDCEQSGFVYRGVGKG